MNELKAIVKCVDMDDEMQQEAVDLCAVAMNRSQMEKDIAAYMKKEFDRKYGPTWHCVVGRNFGTYVTHEVKNFIYFYLGPNAVLLFKSG
ncbi:Dynein light chain DLC [Fasciolopsis buskii]|uniref:Dynein light chain n=1 Tax=Fasciolopsis buskii TaxID=27845 RepID=A0A8E0S283_9TREM|nr:Dynein light chain DLC [Fasciolopsis buski]